MKRGRLYKTILPFIAILALLCGTESAGMLKNSNTLDQLYGGGEMIISSRDDAAEGISEYYVQKYTRSRDAKAAAEQLSLKISDEGTVLLKNNALLPLARESAVTPMGLGLFEPLYCGTGSSAISTEDKDVTSPLEGLSAYFPNLNKRAVSAQQSARKNGEDKASNPLIVTSSPLDGANANLYEFDTGVFDDVKDTLYGTTALVHISRLAGEGRDYHIGAYTDGAPHELALSAAERALLEFAKQNCESVAVIVCCSSSMEIAELEDDPDIDAIIWQGGAGSSGYESVARVLCGEVNPSGRLPVTFTTDFTKNPGFVNHDDGSERFTYSNVSLPSLTGGEQSVAFHEYEEGVYMGYRYYETAFDLGFLDDYYSREDGVVYPFGYGLSYTRFEQKIESVKNSINEYSVTVRVKNVGLYAGREVVQLYFTPPYTALDMEYKIEKPTASLIAFGKTDLLLPGESESVTLTFLHDDLTSYCYTCQNPDGTTGCYMLEQGDYILSIRSDSHNVIDTTKLKIDETQWFCGDPARFGDEQAQLPLNSEGETDMVSFGSGEAIAATNCFEDMNEYMTLSEMSGAVLLSRADWLSTQPTAPTEADRKASQRTAELIIASDAGQRRINRLSASSYPLSGQKNELTLADLRGVPYDDALWDALLDKLTYDDPEAYRRLLFQAAYQTGYLSEINKEHLQGLAMNFPKYIRVSFVANLDNIILEDFSSLDVLELADE